MGCICSPVVMDFEAALKVLNLKLPWGFSDILLYTLESLQVRHVHVCVHACVRAYFQTATLLSPWLLWWTLSHTTPGVDA